MMDPNASPVVSKVNVRRNGGPTGRAARAMGHGSRSSPSM